MSHSEIGYTNTSDAAQSHSPFAGADNNHLRTHHDATIISSMLASECETLGPSLCRRRPGPSTTIVNSPQTCIIGISTSVLPASDELSIPIPTPFEYSDRDEDDYRGYFDFDQAWVGGSRTSATTLLPPPSSSSASHRLPSPQDDQEYYDIMYKLDLGVESPYLGTAYRESFPARILEDPADGNTSSIPHESSSLEPEQESGSKHVDCAMCLTKAVLPCRTKCCDTLLCREHIVKGLHSKDSPNICPYCDSPCILPATLSVNTNRKSGRSRSTSPSRSRSSSSSSSSSNVSTSSSATTGVSSSLSSWPSSGSETEDTWDIKRNWKKGDGGSLDFSEMLRDIVTESMKFVGMSGGRGVGGHVSGQIAVTPIEGLTTERVEVGEVGEVGIPMRVVSVLGLVLILFVLFR